METRLSAIVFSFVTMLTLSTSANVFFQGKAIHGGATANCPVDIMQITWGEDGMNTGDRIQGQIQVRNMESVSSLSLIVQSVDNTGKVVESYSLTPPSHPFSNTYPFYGVINLKYKGYDKEMGNSWFYFDFPRDKNVKGFQIVNVILNGKEVQHNLRIVGNRLSRSLTALPKMKKSGQGEMSITTNWIPEPDAADESEPAKEKPGRKGKQGGVADRKSEIKAMTDEMSGETTYTVQQNWSLSANGGVFSVVPSVIQREEGAATMEILLSGNTTVNTGHGLKLQKILFYNPGTKKRATIDRESSGNWPFFYLGREKKDAKIALTEACAHVFEDATTLQCRLTFGSSENVDARNYDLTFSQTQARAFAALAEKFLGAK